MFDRFKQDLESQSSPVSSRDGCRLRSRVPHYQKSLGTIEKKKNPELTEGLFWYQDFGSSTSSSSFGFAEHTTFRESLANFERALGEGTKSPTTTLQLCILSTSPVSTETYGWLTRLLATNLGRLKAIVSFPRYAVAIEVEEAWGSLSECSYRSVERPEQVPQVDQLSLPEFRKQFQCHTGTDCKCKLFRVSEITNHYDKRPLPSDDVKYGRKMPREVDLVVAPKFLLELPSRVHGGRTLSDEAITSQCERIFSRDTASFTFTWQRGAPLYHGGFDTFLWERFSKPPSCDYAEVFYQDDQTRTQPRRALMTVSTTPTWMRVAPLLASVKLLLDGECGCSILRNPPPDQRSDFYDLIPLFVVFEQIISDTSVFLKQAVDEIMKISFAGRSDASVEKIQYLCHLNDCRQSSALGLEHAHSILTDLVSSINTRANVASSAELEFLEEKEKDMAYLIKRLDALKTSVDNQCVQIKSHRELAQTRQMSTLTYIATIWVPFSFVTGLLSMQVTDPTLLFHHQPSGSSKALAATNDAVTNTTLAARQVSTAATPSPTPTPTAAMLQLLASQLAQESAIANSTAATAANPPTGAYIWSFGFFIGVAGVFFICSLLLPLVGPNLLRIAVQRSYKIRNYYVFWPFLFAFYYIAIYWMIPEITQAALGCHGIECTKEENDYENGRNDYFFIYDFKTSGDNSISTITYVISAVVMGGIGLAQLALAVMYRKGALVTFTWIGFAAVVIVVYFLDYYLSIEDSFSYPIGTGLSLSAIVPLVYLLVVWTAPQLWGLWKSRLRTQSKVKTI